VKSTRYFEEQVMCKWPYLRAEWCERIIAHPVRRERQADESAIGAMLISWGGRALRVVTLDDGEMVHNAFPDRDFEEGRT
jgi:hypothetical protein